MDPRLKDLLAAWQQADGCAGDNPARLLADHADHLLVIEAEAARFRYRHYGRAFTARFGADLTDAVIDMLPSDILTADRRGMLAFEYAFACRVQRPLWRSYTAPFDAAGDETWQRLVLPAGHARLVVGAYPAAPAAAIDPGVALLQLMIERVPVVLDEDGGVRDLALSLQAFGDTKVQVAELEMLASRDPLTGVSNLRHFNHLAGLELEHCHRMARPFALLALDIDHFKRINDSWGHPTGDAALKAFVAACHQALRNIDLLGRSGGEEFAVALPNTGPEAAMTIAERLRRHVEEIMLPLRGGEALRFTVSIGIAISPSDATTIPALMARADEALYRSKREGRNRVTLAREVSS